MGVRSDWVGSPGDLGPAGHIDSWGRFGGEDPSSFNTQMTGFIQSGWGETRPEGTAGNFLPNGDTGVGSLGEWQDMTRDIELEDNVSGLGPLSESRFLSFVLPSDAGRAPQGAGGNSGTMPLRTSTPGHVAGDRCPWSVSCGDCRISVEDILCHGAGGAAAWCWRRGESRLQNCCPGWCRHIITFQHSHQHTHTHTYTRTRTHSINQSINNSPGNPPTHAHAQIVANGAQAETSSGSEKNPALVSKGMPGPTSATPAPANAKESVNSSKPVGAAPPPQVSSSGPCVRVCASRHICMRQTYMQVRRG